MTQAGSASSRALDHFVLTNFNVRLGWARDALGQPVLTPEWMEHRWRLFETFCLPSVQGQSAQRFRWLVRFDPATPEVDRRRFRQLTAGMRHVVPLWRAEPFGAVIGGLVDPSAELLLSTRLDNDDALHRTALTRIQAAVGDAGPEFLNFPEGFRLDLTGDQPKMFRHTNHSNPFLSLVEPVAITTWGRLACRTLPAPALHLLVRVDRSPRLWRPGGRLRASLQRGMRRLVGRLPATVRCVDHRTAAQVAPVRQVPAEPMWLRVIHGRNAGRFHSRGEPCSMGELGGAFGLRLPIDPGLGRGP